MPDHWQVIETTEGWVVERNGAWYSTEGYLEDALGLARNQRAKSIEVEHFDGLKETLR